MSKFVKIRGKIYLAREVFHQKCCDNNCHDMMVHIRKDINNCHDMMVHIRKDIVKPDLPANGDI